MTAEELYESLTRFVASGHITARQRAQMVLDAFPVCDLALCGVPCACGGRNRTHPTKPSE